VVFDESFEDSLRVEFDELLPRLDERSRRLVLGARANSLGRGGKAVVSRAAGVSASTVAQGATEVASGQAMTPGRVRRGGGGRKPLEEKQPGLNSALLALVEPDQRGDPQSPLLWTTKSTRKLADTLNKLGYEVSHNKVAQMLKANGFSLQANAKTHEGGDHPDRDAQFRYISDLVKDRQDAGTPVVSVDAKKKELIGNFKNPGAEWNRQGEPEQVEAYDFPDQALGKVTPYGVYDVTANTGWVSVGVDHDTAVFAVNTIRTWWHTIGKQTYAHAQQLLITADSGGSNGNRVRAWKTELAKLATEIGLTITVCHLPPGTSKWNKIEHRLFSHITMNWRGRPLTSYEVIVNTIATTTTRTGLKVRARLDENEYPIGIGIDDKTMKELKESGTWTPHQWHGEWNYDIHPKQETPS